jgi:uncharacterized protein DUF6166
MRRYIGTRDPKTGNASVLVVDDGGKSHDLPTRTEVRNHSPDGFEWGYGGSGPAQLALAMLCDYFAIDIEGREVGRAIAVAVGRPLGEEWGDEKLKEPIQMAQRIYQEFKWSTVARFDRERGFVLTTGDITTKLRALLEQHRKGSATLGGE